MKIKVCSILQLAIMLYFINLSVSFAQGGYIPWLGDETVAALSKIPGVRADAKSVSLNNAEGKPVSIHIWHEANGSLTAEGKAALTISTPSGGWQLISPSTSLLTAPNPSYFSRPNFEVKLFKINKDETQTWQQIAATTFSNFIEFGGIKLIGRDSLAQRLNDAISAREFREDPPYAARVYSGNCKASEKHVGLRHDEYVNYVGMMSDLDGVPAVLVYEDVNALVSAPLGVADSVHTYRLYAIRTLGFEVKFPSPIDLQRNRIDISVTPTEELTIADIHAGFSQEDEEDGELKLGPWWYCHGN